MREEFIGEAIRPVAGTFDVDRMAVGEPGLPEAFVWRRRTWRIVQVKRSWRSTGPCTQKSGERYVRKHWYEVVVESGEVLKIYFERQARRGARARWRLYSLASDSCG